jgi:hypothetical protein
MRMLVPKGFKNLTLPGQLKCMCYWNCRKRRGCVRCDGLLRGGEGSESLKMEGVFKMAVRLYPVRGRVGSAVQTRWGRLSWLVWWRGDER